MCESWLGPLGAFFASFFLANSSENAVRTTAGCELLRVRAARVVTLKNRVRVAAVVRAARVLQRIHHKKGASRCGVRVAAGASRAGRNVKE